MLFSFDLCLLFAELSHFRTLEFLRVSTCFVASLRLSWFRRSAGLSCACRFFPVCFIKRTEQATSYFIRSLDSAISLRACWMNSSNFSRDKQELQSVLRTLGLTDSWNVPITWRKIHFPWIYFNNFYPLYLELQFLGSSFGSTDVYRIKVIVLYCIV